MLLREADLSSEGSSNPLFRLDGLISPSCAGNAAFLGLAWDLLPGDACRRVNSGVVGVEDKMLSGLRARLLLEIKLHA